MDLGHWETSQPIPAEPFGFVYLITNNANGRMYIGKKLMTAIHKKQPLKGKKNKRHSIKETNWKEYTGSSNDLNEDIVKYTKSQFTFSILKFCTCKWEMSYYEAVEQVNRQVLLSEVYYNGILNLRIGKKPKNVII